MSNEFDCRCSSFVRCEPCKITIALSAGKRFAIRWTQPDSKTGIGDAYSTREECQAVIDRVNGHVTLMRYSVAELAAPSVQDIQAEVQRWMSETKPVDPLDVECDGVLLRTLIDSEEFNRREIGGEYYLCCQMSQPQKDAVSAHWSAQLRAKVAEAKAKERNAVTYCEEDEP